MVLNSNLKADHSYLSYIAQKTGGVYLNLNRLTSKEAFSQMTKQTFSFIRAKYNKRQIKEVYPSIPTAVNRDFSISGQIKSKSANITLYYGLGGRALKKYIFKIKSSDTNYKTGLVSQVWAQKKLAELDMRYEKNRDEIIYLGKKYKMVTRETSFIVLDRLEDYVKYKIIPPKELRSQYYEILKQQQKQKQRKHLSHIDSVVRRFQELKRWWKKKFPKDKPFVNINKKKGTSDIRRTRTTSRRRNEYTENGDKDIEDEKKADDPREERQVKKEKEKKPQAKEQSGIKLAKWTPDTPYLKKLKAVKKYMIYKVYLKLKEKYKNSSAFYLDVADFFISAGMKKLALRILSNIAEMELENPQLLRILGQRLSQLGYYNLAIFIFKDVLKMRREEPQSHRDLGLVYEKAGKYQKAVNHLYEVVRQPWDSRFSNIEIIALHEMNAIIGRNRKRYQFRLRKFDKRLIKNLPVDIKVVLNWDADNTDMDLWVTDPNNEKCDYSHKLTYIGGLMSNDYTQGYGPEVFMLKSAKRGEYQIQVNYYGNSQQILAGATTIQVQLFLNYGKRNQVLKEITLRLKDQKEVVKVGTFFIKIRRGKLRISH